MAAWPNLVCPASYGSVSCLLFNELHRALVIAKVDISIRCCGHSAFNLGSEREHVLKPAMLNFASGAKPT